MKKFTSFEALFLLWTSFMITYAGGDIQVIGRIGETVTLQCPLNSPTKISWMFGDNGENILLAEYRNLKFIRVNNKYFNNRLEGSNSGSALRIKNLRIEDSGVFTARITVNGSTTDINYILNVFGRGDLILQVNSRVGENVTLPTYPNLAAAIERVSWMFHVNGKKKLLAEFRNHKFITVNKNYFLNRLEKADDGTALRIRELKLEDSGIFTAHILVNGRKRDISYIIAVFVTGKDPDPLTGHVQGSVELLYNIPVPVDLAIWDFSCSGKKGKVAEFIQQKFSITREEFRSRLECSNNGTTLIIRNLTKEDSGIYTVQIYDTEHDKYEMSYNLSVFELVPKPQIKEEEKRNETGQCNYTLHCSVPSDSSALSYSWMYRYNNSEYHHYANGSTIHISSHNKPLECICFVQNPGHKNNDTFVLPACSEILMEEKKRRRDSLIIMICVCGPFAGLAVAQVFLFVRKRRQRKKKKDMTYSKIQFNTQKSTNQTVPSPNGFSSNPLLHSETTYIDVKR